MPNAQSINPAKKDFVLLKSASLNSVRRSGAISNQASRTTFPTIPINMTFLLYVPKRLKTACFHSPLTRSRIAIAKDNSIRKFGRSSAGVETMIRKNSKIVFIRGNFNLAGIKYGIGGANGMTPTWSVSLKVFITPRLFTISRHCVS